MTQGLQVAQEQLTRCERAVDEARVRREQQQATCQRLQLELGNLRQLITLGEEELARLGLELAGLKGPDSEAVPDLAPLLAEQRNLEAQQLACHQRLAELERQLTELEQARRADHKQLVTLQEKLATLRLERERSLTRRQGLHEQFEELGGSTGRSRSGGADRCRSRQAAAGDPDPGGASGGTRRHQPGGAGGVRRGENASNLS